MSGWLSHGIASLSLPLAAPRGNWRSGPIKASAPTEIPSALRILWGPTCVSALARVTKATSPVGADALVRPPAQAATTAQAARSEAERAEKEADQIQFCTPTQGAPAPRESAVKSAPHSAAPVGEPSRTRRHPLTPTPVQQLCTHVQSCGQSAFFSYTGRGAFSFWR